MICPICESETATIKLSETEIQECFNCGYKFKSLCISVEDIIED